MTEFNGHTEEEAQNQTQEEKKSKQEHSEGAILVLKNKNYSDHSFEERYSRQKESLCRAHNVEEHHISGNLKNLHLDPEQCAKASVRNKVGRGCCKFCYMDYKNSEIILGKKGVLDQTLRNAVWKCTSGRLKVRANPLKSCRGK